MEHAMMSQESSSRSKGLGGFGNRWALLTLVVLALSALFAGGLWLADARVGPGALAAPPSPPVRAAAPTPPVPSFADLAAKVAPSVVNLTVSKKVKGAVFQFPSPFGPGDPFGEFFGQFEHAPVPRVERGIGSGVIISSDGYVLTNNHVVDDADEITVRLLDKRKFKGKVIGRDPKTDLALVKVDSDKPLPAAELGDSDSARVGDWVVAVGNPFGLDHTVTAGIVSAKGRALEGPYDDFIQTDASINPGNSGGPLLDLQGKVIGINAQIMAGGRGIGFAIPVNLAKTILPDLKNKGYVARGWLGVAIQDLTEDMASHFGLKSDEGALVASVTDDGPADKAGIRRADVIVLYDGKPIKDSHDLPILVASTPIGKRVEIKVIRDGKPQVLKVKIGRLEEGHVALSGEKGASDQRLGLAVQRITPETAREMDLENLEGVIVVRVQPESPDAGLRRGDVIREVNQNPVRNPQQFASALRRGDAKSVLLLVERQGDQHYVTISRG
jgi:serine protease Do